MTTAIGIDIGGTGIKGAIVDVDSGELLSDRIKKATPKGGKPDEIVDVVVSLIPELGSVPAETPVGVCFPAVVQHGTTMSAANVSKKWIGLEAEKLFEKAIGRDITFVNDADAAGYAESEFGAAKGQRGLVLLTTLGTGIGSAIIYNGVLVPNAELGHIALDGHEDYEKVAAYAAMEREKLSWKAWGARLQKYYAHLEMLFSPTCSWSAAASRSTGTTSRSTWTSRRRSCRPPSATTRASWARPLSPPTRSARASRAARRTWSRRPPSSARDATFRP
ncbi:hypothetical protein GCM10025866_26960 [Naasia aerilata]|uniref:Polyphosphate glucokinase n=1 Tax=Naasia aerilata TaxID=1162966 RepID=A0ABN6XSA4_9MICO|nr:hypothetical protein GCM10025866_26960 [Naasia aerilata]